MTLGVDGIAGFLGPRQELVQPIDGVSVDHALEDVDEIGVGLNTVEFGGFNQRANDRPTLAAGVASCEQVILATEGYGTNRALDGLVSSSMRPFCRKRVNPCQGESA